MPTVSKFLFETTFYGQLPYLDPQKCHIFFHGCCRGPSFPSSHVSNMVVFVCIFFWGPGVFMSQGGAYKFHRFYSFESIESMAGAEAVLWGSKAIARSVRRSWSNRSSWWKPPENWPVPGVSWCLNREIVAGCGKSTHK
jgi:hypothetical protein